MATKKASKQGAVETAPKKVKADELRELLDSITDQLEALPNDKAAIISDIRSVAAELQIAVKEVATTHPNQAEKIVSGVAALLNSIGSMMRIDQSILELDRRGGALVKDILSYTSRAKGGLKKKANSPKQAAKESALQLWKERHQGKQPKLRTVEQFAVEVMRRNPVLQCSGTIEAWSAKWSKQVKSGENPTC